MSSRKESAGDSAAEQEAADAPSVGSFSKQYDAYQAALREIVEKGVTARREAAAAYRNKLSDALAEVNVTVREAYLGYITAYYGHEARDASTPDVELARAEFEYREAERQSAEAASQACEVEWQAYCDRIAEIDQQDASKWNAAFADYFRQMRQSIASLDPADPRDVQEVVNTLSLACVSALSGSAG